MKSKSELLLFLVLIAVALPFLNSFANGFVNWDDPGAIVDNERIRDLSVPQVVHLFSEPVFFAYVPFYFVSLSIDHFFFGLDPFGFHLGSLLLHLLNSALVFLLVKRATGSVGAAAVTTLVFGVHPVQVECVTWMAGRKDPLCLFFLLVGLYSFDLALVAPTRGSRWRRVSAAILLAVGASLTKATALVFPGLFLLWHVAVGKRAGEARRFLWVHVVSFGLALVGVVFHFSIARSSGVAVARTSGFSERIVSALQAFFFQVRTLFLPFDLSPDYSREAVSSISAGVGAGILAILLGILLVGIWRRRTGLTLAAGLILLGFLPYNTVFPATDVLRADRYLYLAATGFGLFVGLATMRAGRLKAFAFGVLLLGYVLLGTTTYLRNRVWKDSVTLWAAAVDREGSGPFSAIKLGEAYVEEGLRESVGDRRAARMLLAKNAFLDAISGFPRPIHELQALSRLGRVCLLAGDFDEARAHLSRALSALLEGRGVVAAKSSSERSRLQSDLLLNLSEAVRGLGDDDGAIVSLREAVAINPENANAYYNLGNLLCRQGLAASSRSGKELIDEGRRHLERAYDLDPSSTGPLLVLGEVSFLQRKRVESVRWFELAKKRDPNSAAARIQLAKVFLQGGDPTAALAEIDGAVALDREAIEPRLVKAQFLAALGNAEGSRTELEALLAMRPDDVAVTSELSRLEARGAEKRVKLLFSGQAPEGQKRRLLEEATALADRAVGLSPTAVGARLVRGDLFRFRRKWPEAVEEFSVALEAAPRDPDVIERAADCFKDAGYAHLLRKEKAEAIELFERAITLRPDAEDHGAIRGLVTQYHARRIRKADEDRAKGDPAKVKD